PAPRQLKCSLSSIWPCLSWADGLCAPSCCFFLASPRSPRRSSLFPYTTLFRSQHPKLVLHLRLRERYEHIGTAQVAVPLRDLVRSEEHTSELQSCFELVCRLLLEKKKNYQANCTYSDKED